MGSAQGHLGGSGAQEILLEEYPSSQLPRHSSERTRLPMQEMLETSVPSLGREDPLEKEMATHSSILA